MAREHSNPRALALRTRLEAAIPANYRPRRHLALNFGLVGLALVGVLAGLREVAAAELLVLPCTFVAMNLLEYVSHRTLMHRRIPGAQFVFDAHTRRHHASFGADNMAIRSEREIGLIVFGVREIVGFLLAALPGLGLLLALGSRNCALLALAMVLVHYLLYEGLHLLAHLPDDHAIAGRPIFAAARRRHAHHHGAADSNFNVTMPVSDWLFGTLR